MTSTAHSEQPKHVDRVVALPERTPQRRQLSARRVARLAAGMVLLGLALKWVWQRGTEFTDDARLETHVAPISARFVGRVEKVHVADDQWVEAGALLVQFDDKEQLAELAAARAELAQAQAQLTLADVQRVVVQRESEANLMQARGELLRRRYATSETGAMIAHKSAGLTRSKEQLALAISERERAQRLKAQSAQSESVLDIHMSQSSQAAAAVQMAEAELSAVRAARAKAWADVASARGLVLAAETGEEQVRIADANVAVAQARVDHAAASVSVAEQELSYTQLRAPFRGVVARRNVEAGQQVSPGRPLLALVASDDAWVVANFKERDLAGLRKGQAASVHLDMYGKSFAAHVASIGPASGARFSVLPADNASGNFVKIEQRVPVVIRFDRRPAVPLPAGLSAEVTVDTAKSSRL